MGKTSLVVIFCAATICRAGDIDEEPTACELMDKYATNQDRLESWTIKSIHSRTSRTGSDEEHEQTRVYDVRFDGRRISVRWEQYEDACISGEPGHRMLLWDGERYINYGSGIDPNQPGTAIVNKTPPDRDVELLQHSHPCATLLGYYDSATCQRLDTALRQASLICLRKKRERIDDVDCWVIEAATDHGDYTVWIDPEHGYTAAQVHLRTVTRGKPPRRGGKPICTETMRTITNTRFDEIDGAWIPVESDHTYRLTSSAKGDDWWQEEHIEVTEIVLNPDHEALGSFLADNIPNGTHVSLYPLLQISYTWEDGELVPLIDEAVVTAIDKTLATMMADRDDTNDNTNLNETVASATGAAVASDAVKAFASAARSPKASSLGPRPHCGLYCLYSLLTLSGRETDYHSLVKPEYYGSRQGSSLAELNRAATDRGLHARTAARLSTRALRRCPCPALLHVRPHSEAREYNHYELFLGTENGRAKLFDPPEAPRLVDFEELAARWDGAALLVSARPVDIGPVFAPDRQRLLLYGMGGVLALLALHMGRRLWLRFVGAMPRRWSLGLTLGQAGALGLAAFFCAMLYHFANDEALLANANATVSLQQAYRGTFIPKIGRGEVRKLLGTDTVIIDARRARDYQAGHLDGAINLPVDANEALWEETTAILPQDKPIMVYCQSAGCKYAERVSVALLKDGFSGISIYRGGWHDWTAKQADTEKEDANDNDPNEATSEGGPQIRLEKDPPRPER